jgi:solute carrier family 25 aspartate/glutamate transporter 12/13
MAQHIVRSEGVAGLYRGLPPNLIGVFPEKALKLAVNDTAREWFTSARPDGKIRRERGGEGAVGSGAYPAARARAPAANARASARAAAPLDAVHEEIFSGGLAGFIQVAVTCPMEYLKIQGQLGHGSAAKIFADVGVRGVYRGVAATWLRDVPFSFIFFPLFANVKAALGGDHSLPALFASGAIAGSLAAGAVTPCDVIKTRLQAKGAETRYAGIADAVAKIARDEGAAAFAKGLVPRMLVQAPLFGCTLLSYEILKAFYRSHSAPAPAPAPVR